MMTALVESTHQFKAFADPTRLRILNLLSERELCVCHLADILEEPQPKVSRHLAMLRSAGLASARVEGPWRRYALPAKPTGLTATLLGCVASCLGGLDQLRADRARLASLNTDLACNQ